MASRLDVVGYLYYSYNERAVSIDLGAEMAVATQIAEQQRSLTLDDAVKTIKAGGSGEFIWEDIGRCLFSSTPKPLKPHLKLTLKLERGCGSSQTYYPVPKGREITVATHFVDYQKNKSINALARTILLADETHGKTFISQHRTDDSAQELCKEVESLMRVVSPSTGSSSSSSSSATSST